MTGPFDPGTIADTVEPLRDLRPVQPTRDPLAIDPGFGELFDAQRRVDRVDRTDFETQMLAEGYAPIVEALGLGDSQNPASFHSGGDGNWRAPLLTRSELLARQGRGGQSAMTTRETQEQLVAGAIRERRQSEPDFLPGVPDDVKGLRAWFVEQQKARRAEARTVLGRASGWRGTAATLSGSLVELGSDPANVGASILTAPVGGGGGALRIFGREFLMNSGIEAVLQPWAARNRAILGEELTIGEAAANVGIAGVAGGTLATGLHYGGRGVGKLYDLGAEGVFKAMPESVQRRWADRMKAGGVTIGDLYGDLDNRELADFAKNAVGEDALTPDEQAAINVLTREQEIGEASPFEPGPDGDGAHTQRLADALAALVDGPTAAPATALGTGTVARTAARPISRDETIRFVLNDLEGGDAVVRYSQADGGTTKWGIAAKFNPGVDVASLTEAQAAAIARRDYWFAGLDQAPPATAAVAFDAGFISGPKVGQRILAASGGNPERAIALYRAHLNRIADTVPGKAKYRKGWNNRVDKLAARLGLAGNGRAAPLDGLDGLGEARGFGEGMDAELALARAGVEGADPLARAADDAPLFEPVPILRREQFDSDESWIEAQMRLGESLDRSGAGEMPPVAGGNEGRSPAAPQAAGNGPPARETGAGPAEPEVAVDGLPAAAQRAAASRIVTRRHQFEETGGPVELGVATADGNVFWSAGETTIIPRGGRRRYVDDPEARTFEQLVSAEDPAIVVPPRSAAAGEYEVRRSPFPSGGFDVFDANGVRLVERNWKPGETPRRYKTEAAALKAAPKLVPQTTSDLTDLPLFRAEVRLDDPALTAFDDPGGAGRLHLVESLEHDLRADIAAEPELLDRAFDLGEGDPRPLRQILDELEQEATALSAVRACMAGGGA